MEIIELRLKVLSALIKSAIDYYEAERACCELHVPQQWIDDKKQAYDEFIWRCQDYQIVNESDNVDLSELNYDYYTLLETKKQNNHKFNVGDWVCDETRLNIKQIIKIKADIYYFANGGGVDTSYIDHNYHLWSINDAKYGDILYSSYCNLIWIYKDEKTCYVGSNLNYNSGGIVINIPIYIPTDVRPATKEQCNFLLQQIKENEYEWNIETKELKKINSYCEKYCLGYQETGKCYSDGDCEAKIKAEQNHVCEWSEEDEKMLKTVKALAYNHNNDFPVFSKIETWIESLKQRTTLKSNIQPKQWSEEDEVKINRIVAYLENLNVADNDILLKDVGWLKSLKNRVIPQQEWSEEEKNNIDTIVSRLEVDIEYWESRSKRRVDEDKRIINWLKSIKNIVIPQQEWSEEDEQFFRKAITIIDYVRTMGVGSPEYYQDISNWLQCLKRNIHQIKKEWSEEDKRNLQGIIDEIKANKNSAPEYDIATYDRFINWLKSLAKE